MKLFKMQYKSMLVCILVKDVSVGRTAAMANMQAKMLKDKANIRFQEIRLGSFPPQTWPGSFFTFD